MPGKCRIGIKKAEELWEELKKKDGEEVAVAKLRSAAASFFGMSLED